MARKCIVLAVGFVLVALGIAPVAAQDCTPVMAFVADVTIPDDTPVSPGDTFVKTWRLQNAGHCEWAETYSVAFAGGEALATVTEQRLAGKVAPGETTDVSVEMKAPAVAGSYTSWWQMVDDAGKPFGDKFYVRVVAAAPGSAPAEAPAEVKPEAPEASQATAGLGVRRDTVQAAFAGMGFTISEGTVCGPEKHLFEGDEERCRKLVSESYGPEFLGVPDAHASGPGAIVDLMGSPEALLAGRIVLTSAEEPAQWKYVEDFLALIVPNQRDAILKKAAGMVAAAKKDPENPQLQTPVVSDRAVAELYCKVDPSKAAGFMLTLQQRLSRQVPEASLRPGVGLGVTRDFVQSVFKNLKFHSFQEPKMDDELTARLYGRDLVGQPVLGALAPGNPSPGTSVRLVGPPDALLCAEFLLTSRDAGQQQYVADLLSIVAPDHKEAMLRIVTDSLAKGKQPTLLTETDFGDVHFLFECKVSPYTNEWYYRVMVRKGPLPAAAAGS